METIHLISLGCPKNLVDSERMLGLLERSGYALTEEAEEADVVIVNTCGFIAPAKEESLSVIFEAARLKEEGRCKALIVAGCLSQRYGDTLRRELPEADAILGLSDVERIVAHCDRLLGHRRSKGFTAECAAEKGQVNAAVEKSGVGSSQPLPFSATSAVSAVKTKGFSSLPSEAICSNGARHLLTPKHSAYLRIADGCDNHCSYCAIPLIRGPYRSRPEAALIAEARALCEQGVRELNLIAQDTTRYGADLYGESRLSSLIDALSKLDDLCWIRLLYTHPAHFSQDLIGCIARNEKVCRYVDLPIQHISDPLLRAMNRKVTGDDIRNLMQRLRSGVPGIALRTSLIVGFPGETKAHFEELLDFVAEARFERLGAFTYSREEDTPAFAFDDQVPEEVKRERLDRLMMLQQEITAERHESLIGTRVQVLVDRPGDQAPIRWVGRAAWDAPDVDGQVLITQGDALPGDFVSVAITDADAYDLWGTIESEKV
ncbi:MAG: 30S ribosomal protein S12 methylthiotransferase RimO [Candidatus Latescibacteria bacterium]|nr:30S ribosomal protein S12 methylthiotransferase RimO [Candidatus Latescibacterota bacterium]